MKTIHSEGNQVLMLEPAELRDIEKRSVVAAKMAEGTTVVVGAFSLVQPKGTTVVKVTAEGQEQTFAKSPNTVLQAIAEYKTPARVNAVLAAK